MAGMKSKDIQTSFHHPPVSDFTFYRRSNDIVDALPITHQVASREVTLPFYSTLKFADVELVIAAVYETLKEFS